MDQPGGPGPEVFAKRVTLLAKAGFAAGVAVLVLAGLGGALGGGRSSPFAWYKTLFDGYRFTELRTVLAFLGGIVRSGLETAVMICGVSAILLILLRLVGSGQKPSWAPLLDDAFVTRAKVFAIALQVLAWLFLVCQVLSGPMWYYQIFSRTRTSFSMSMFDRACQMAFWGTQCLTTALSRFFIFMSGALIIRAFLLLSRSSAGGGESAPEGSPCQ